MHPKVTVDGNSDGDVWSFGMVAGLLNDIYADGKVRG